MIIILHQIYPRNLYKNNIYTCRTRMQGDSKPRGTASKKCEIQCAYYCTIHKIHIQEIWLSELNECLIQKIQSRQHIKILKYWFNYVLCPIKF